ncbi:hypothetical protein SGLAM104S_06500 [Streptomyces glaucescens]
MTARPSRASRERLSRLSRATWRWWSMHSLIAALNSVSERLPLATPGQSLLETFRPSKSTILNSGWLPVRRACAASR